MLHIHRVGNGKNQNSSGNIKNLTMKADDSPEGNRPETEDDKVSNAFTEPRGSDSSITWWFRLHIAISVVIYTGLGTWVFQQLEGKPELERLRLHRMMLTSERQKLIQALQENLKEDQENRKNGSRWNSTVAALAQYESAIGDIFDVSLKIYLNETAPLPLQWEAFTNVYLFVLAVVTTIGYGNITPKTVGGRVFCIIFGVIGIPFMIILLAQCGKIFASFCSTIYTKIFGKKFVEQYSAAQNPSMLKKVYGSSISITAVMTFLFSYMAVGACLFNYTERWGFINSFYYCFVTMTTIGFGDLIPASPGSSRMLLIGILRGFYTLFGLAITASAIELVRKHYAAIWTNEAELRRQIWVKTQASTKFQICRGNTSMN